MVCQTLQDGSTLFSLKILLSDLIMLKYSMAAEYLILSQRTCCRVSFPPDVACTQLTTVADVAILTLFSFILPAL